MYKILDSERKLTGHIALLAANIMFGLNIPIVKSVLASGAIQPLGINMFRVGGGAMLFWVASLFVPHEKVSWRDLLLLFGASFFGAQLNQLTFLIGLSMTSPIDASIIATSGPILTMLLAALFLGEPISGKKITGVLIGAVGALILILGASSKDAGGSNTMGNLLCLLSALSFATYLTLFKGVISRYSPITLMKWVFLFATVCSAPFGIKPMMEMDLSLVTTPVMWGIIYAVVCSTFFTYILLPIGQKRLRPTLVSMYMYAQPLFASVAAVLVGMDVFGWDKIIAAMLVFAGVYVVTLSRAKGA